MESDLNIYWTQAYVTPLNSQNKSIKLILVF